jgi:SAM-dependent methyltransferase
VNGVCAACGRGDLRPHLRVAGEAGAPGLIPTTDRFGTALGDIVRCRDCGHMQVDPFPAEEELREAYGAAESEEYLVEEEGQRETARRLLARLERHTARGALLDLGCWTGFLLAEARGRGWEPLGVEPSEFASAYAGERLGLPVIRASLGEADLPRGHFSGVVMADVIEHLPDPGGALDCVAASLAPAGALCLVLPDAGSLLARVLGRRWWSVIPTHVQYFTRESLAVLLARHGFRVRETATAPKAFSVRYYLGRVGGYSPALARTLVAGADRAGLAERMWAPDFRDRMVAIATHGRRIGGGPQGRS